MKQLQATRYSCADSFKTYKIVTLNYQIERKGDEIWLRLEGGPTGFESCQISAIDFRERVKDGQAWNACYGTPYRYDRLIVENQELKRILIENIAGEPWCPKADKCSYHKPNALGICVVARHWFEQEGCPILVAINKVEERGKKYESKDPS